MQRARPGHMLRVPRCCSPRSLPARPRSALHEGTHGRERLSFGPALHVREPQPEGPGRRGRSSPTCRLQLRDRRRVPEGRLGELAAFEQLVALTLQARGTERGGGDGGRRGGRVPGAPPAARVPGGVACRHRRRGPLSAPLVHAGSGRPTPPRRAPLRPLAALAFAGQLLLDVAHGARLGGAPGSRRLRGLCGKWMRETSVCIIRRNYLPRRPRGCPAQTRGAALAGAGRSGGRAGTAPAGGAARFPASPGARPPRG